VLGVRDNVGVLKLDDATERAMKRPLALGCVCQVRLRVILLQRHKTLVNSKDNGRHETRSITDDAVHW
jgi:hypothetical protein